MSEPASFKSASSVGNLRERVSHLSTFLSGREGSAFEASILRSPAFVPVNETRVKDPTDWSKLRDVFTEIGLSIQTLLEHGLTSGQIVEARNAAEGRRHVARVVALGFHSTDGNVDFPRKDVAYVAPLLVQSLRLNCHLKAFLPARQGADPADWITINPVRCLEGQATKTSSLQGDSLADAIPVAKKVVFQKIGEPKCSVLHASSSASESKNVSEKALRRHFKHSQRCLSLGDVFGLWVEKCSRPKSPWDMFQSNHQRKTHSSMQWQSYRVVEVEPSAAMSVAIDPTTTMVSLKGGTTWGSCPIGLRGYASAAQNQLTYSATSIEDIRGHRPTTPLSKQSLELLGDTTQAPELDFPKMEGVGAMLPLWRELAELICPLLHTLATDMEFRVSILLTGPAGCGKKTALDGACRALGLKLITVNCMDLKSSTDRATSSKLNALFEHSLEFSPCALLLKNVDKLGMADEVPSPAALAMLYNITKQGCAKGEEQDNGIIEKRLAVIVGTSNGKDMQPALRRCFTHEIAVEPPDATGRERLLQNFLGLQPGACGEVISEAVKQTAGVFPRDLKALAADARATASSRSITPTSKNTTPLDQPCTSTVQMPANVSENHPIEDRNSEASAASVHGVADSGPCVVDLDDLGKALDRVKKRTALEIGAPKVPDVRWDDVGGLEDVKKVILETVELPMKHKQLFGSGVKRRSGVLLYGPPGVGKTLIAKAIATECSINFMSVKGPELLNMYIGESERHVREVFERARRAKPCVVFFDELDALAPARGVAGDSAGVMDRVVSQLLAEIDGIQGSNTDVFIFGATNRPDLVDPALIRPGRLDALVYVGLPSGAPSRVKILKALTRKFHMTDEVDLESIAEKCPERFTGADLYALCADAWMVAMREIINSVGGSKGRLEALQDDPSFKVVLSQGNFMQALAKLKPSLSEEQAQQYLRTREQYERS
ncbi:hypothetical protein BSKO_03120 [Bryopsis sp. KO-2023]|nr:hypothetical protein BSKO_03120 [Bryopsis sp. KO-2023]